MVPLNRYPYGPIQKAVWGHNPYDTLLLSAIWLDGWMENQAKKFQIPDNPSI